MHSVLKKMKLLFSVSLSLLLYQSVFAQQPNVLFVISDDQSFAHTSYAGCTFVNTPAFDRIAHEGCYFPNAYAASPGCAPSRSAIVTGRYPWQNEQAGQHGSFWPKKYISFIDLLKNSGYDVGRTGKGVDPFQYAENESDTLFRYRNAAGTAGADIKYQKGDAIPAKGISKTNYAAEFENFVEQSKNQNKPFFFWYGSHEPHRGYEKDSWIKQHKQLSAAKVPFFLPDVDLVRGDLLDYSVEIEWFDTHLDKMISYLKEIGEYDNTIIMVTSDNGMPFPRAKANCYEYGIHVPLAIKFAKGTSFNKRIYEGNVSLAQMAPTILELCGVSAEGMLPMSNISLLAQLKGEVKEQAVFSSRERHSSSRYQNWGYPQRAIVDDDLLLIWNMKPERWPAGAPQRYASKDTTLLLNMYSLDEKGKYTQDEIFADVDGSPSKTYLIENHNDRAVVPFFIMAFDFRPEFELYDLKADPGCVKNLQGNAAYNSAFTKLFTALVKELVKTNDPRLGDKNPEVFDSYPRFMAMKYFPRPSANEEEK